MKLLLTGAFSYSDAQLKKITDLGHTYIFVQDEKIPLQEQGINTADIEGVICNGLFLYNDLVAFPNLRYVQLTSAGFDRVPLVEMADRGITVHNARGVYSAPMAEFAISCVLQLYKQSSAFLKNQSAHRWEKQRNLKELLGKTVCIVGCGSVGQACAKRFAAFDCCVLGVDAVQTNAPFFDVIYPLEQLNKVLSMGDIVVLAIPLTEQTRQMFDKKRLLCCKPGSVFVNISRGKVVVESDLCDLLQTGHFEGAVLDVFETEPLPEDNPLWNIKNVILTPHNSFVGEGNNERMFATIIENLQK